MGVRPRVVVIGAGFGGLEVARGLAAAPVDVLLVDRHNFHTFHALLYQVATSGLNAADVAHAVRGLFHKQRNVDFRRGEVTGVDWHQRHVELDGQAPVPFDHLVVAGGSTVAFFGVDGAAEHAFPLYTLHDAVRLRNHTLERFEAAAADPSLLDDGVLTFTIVGGGPTGVETAGAMAELFAVVFRKDYPSLDVARARVVLVELRPHLLSPFSDVSQQHALETLRRRGVEVRLGEQLTAVRPDAITLASGEELATHTVVWAAGVRANPLAERLGLGGGPGGRIPVGADLAVAGHAGVWAIGDIAHVVDLTGAALPQLAPVAMQQGRHVARQIQRLRDGRGTEAFRYVDKGTMATIGRRAAVAELPLGIKLSGTVAWFAWLGLHLRYLVGKRNRASVLLNWAWNYLTWDRGPRLILHADRVPDAVSKPR